MSPLKKLYLYDVHALCSAQQIEHFMGQLLMNLGIYLTNTTFLGGEGGEKGGGISVSFFSSCRPHI